MAMIPMETEIDAIILREFEKKGIFISGQWTPHQKKPVLCNPGELLLCTTTIGSHGNHFPMDYLLLKCIEVTVHTIYRLCVL